MFQKLSCTILSTSVLFLVVFPLKTTECQPRRVETNFLPRTTNFTYSNRQQSFNLISPSLYTPARHGRRRSGDVVKTEKVSSPGNYSSKSFMKRKALVDDSYTWPVKRVAEIEGDIVLGGLMMVHEREDKKICGPIMPQGGIQALECMLYTLDWINNQTNFLPGIKLGSYVLDDCDKDTYGLEQAVDFIKGKKFINKLILLLL
ncbi:Metabotropic glutamate receptor 2 [Araneus ventricosus]|uniref:Metabotropic glutamate receptor 2 n=1 Tax=Araneus ventricosus TaxID=182803 RepID=A0A4Y2D0S6_ARAVE|nr:Metabotropic glutamate receptor 2 [Araneus ventricosus]